MSEVDAYSVCRCWCVLIGKMFIYFKTPNDQVCTSLPLENTALCKERLAKMTNMNGKKNLKYVKYFNAPDAIVFKCKNMGFYKRKL
jgi:hypothetical protein